MDGQEQLRAYTLQIVALGQAALAVYRRGEWLPDELIALADDLLALEARLGAAAALPEPDAALATPEVEKAAAEPSDEAAGEAQEEAPAESVALAESETGDDLAPLFVTVAADDADDWLQALAAEPGEPSLALPDDDILVLDVEQEPGGGPAVIDEPLTALPPLVIDAARDLPPEEELSAPDDPSIDDGEHPILVGAGAPTVFSSDVSAWLPAAEPAPAAPAGDAATPDRGDAVAPPADEEPAVGEHFCANCGAALRPGKRFCYRCGAPVALPAPPAVERPAPAPSPPLSEMPTIIGGPYRSESAPAIDVRASAVRFCNHCGRGVAEGETVCPECGSRDIG